MQKSCPFHRDCIVQSKDFFFLTPSLANEFALSTALGGAMIARHNAFH